MELNEIIDALPKILAAIGGVLGSIDIILGVFPNRFIKYRSIIFKLTKALDELEGGKK